MPKKINNRAGSNTIAKPKDFGLATGVDRYNPTTPKGGGPAMRVPGHKLGKVDVPGVARMNPKTPSGGGPAVRHPGERLGQVINDNPQIRLNPPMKP